MKETRESECCSIADRPHAYTCVCVGQSPDKPNTTLHSDNLSPKWTRKFKLLPWLPLSSSQRCRNRGFNQSAVIYLWTFLLLLQSTGVLSQLQYTRTPSNARIAQGQEAVLTCAGSDPTKLLIWQKDGTNLFFDADRQPGVDNSYSLVNVSDLKVTSATSANSGSYACTVRGLPTVSATLTILVPPDEPVISPDTTNLRLTEGDEFVLTCSSSRGSPAPEIQWKRNGVSIPGGDPTTTGDTTSSKLTLTLTWEDNQATYGCEVWNEVNANAHLSTNKTLQVRYAPQITFRPFDPSYVVVLGQDVSITCGVKAFPIDGIEYSWQKDNIRLPSVSNELRFPSAEKTDSGLYSCSAFNGVGQAKTKALTLIVQYGPEILNLPESVIVSEGGKVNLTCETDALPRIRTVTWRSTTSGNVIYTANLLISPVTRTDADNYTCSVENVLNPSGVASVSKPARQTVQVLVQYIPGQAIVVSPGSHSIGDRVELQCQLPKPGYPVGSVEWKKGESIQSGQGSVYVIDSAVLSDSGVYSCRGSNPLGVGEWGSIPKFINEPPRIVSTLPPTRNISIKLPKFQLSCEARGRPAPQIEWLKNGETVSETYYEILEEAPIAVDVYSFKVKSSLRFKGSARSADGGRVDQILITDTANYTCSVSGDASQTTQLFVQYPPVVTVDPRKTTENSSSVTFRCVAQSNPEPLFKWEFNNVELNSVGKYRIQSGGRGDQDLEFISTLIISDITNSELGNYTCTATNSLGGNSATGQVVVKSKPDPPSNLKVLDQTWTSILLQWKPGFNGGKEQTFLITHESEDQLERKEVKTSPYNITGLLPSVTYKLSVVGKNSFGEGDNSDLISVTTLSHNMSYPAEVKFNPKTGILSFRPPDDRSYSALIRVMVKDSSQWTVAEEKADVQAGSVKLPQTDITRVEISFCLQENVCSKAIEAKFDAVTAGSSGPDLPTGGVIAIAVLCAVIIIILFVVLFCVIRRKRKEKAARDFELETQPNRRSQPIAPKITNNTPKQGYDNPDFNPNSVHHSRPMNGHIPSRNNDHNPYIYEDTTHKNNTSFESRDVKKYEDFIPESYGDQPLTFHPYSTTNYYQPDDNYYRERRMSGQKDPSMSGQESGYSTPEPSKPKKVIYEVVV